MDKDYILYPKEDGYRGVHLVMKYRTSESSSGGYCNRLRVEILLMASVIALKERLPLVPYTDDLTVYNQLRLVSQELKVIPLFEDMSHVVEFLNDESREATRSEDLYLLESDSETRQVNYTIYRKADFDDASAL